jgi:hypothetical protein
MESGDDMAKRTDTHANNFNDMIINQVIERCDAMTLDSGEIRSEIETLKSTNREQNQKYNILMDLTIKKDKTMSIMASRLLDLEKRSMSHSIKVRIRKQKNTSRASYQGLTSGHPTSI